MKKILVTGGAGFIGSHVVDCLIKKGYKVVVIDDLSSGSEKNLNKKIKFINYSINDDLKNLFKKEKFDYVFHLAAKIDLRYSLKNPKEDAETNIIGSLNLIENCIKYKIKRFIFSSSAAVYSPKSKTPFTEKSLVDPSSPYGLSKLTVENYLKIMNCFYGLNFVSLRYSNVYGPRQKSYGEAGVISIFFSNILKGKILKIFGDGNQTRDFIYVKDIAKSNIFAMEKELSGIYNISTNSEISINKLVEIIKKITKSNLDVKYCKEVSNEIKNCSLSNTKIMKKGWHPKINLEKGLLKTRDYFKKLQK
jgi:UDP-glucose 4-epimerase|tara:strand:- start:420 stop:1337 length:918 start_codon:yes stop_codon:yes gene_type:complete